MQNYLARNSVSAVILGTRRFRCAKAPACSVDLGNLRCALIVFEIPHPLGPIAGLATTSLRPGAVHRILAVPFKRPKLFKSRGPDRPVHIQHINSCLVSVYCKMHHLIAVVNPLAVELRGNDTVEGFGQPPCIAGAIAGPASPPHSIRKNWDVR